MWRATESPEGAGSLALWPGVRSRQRATTARWVSECPRRGLWAAAPENWNEAR
jgi:hypothetical protein